MTLFILEDGQIVLESVLQPRCNHLFVRCEFKSDFGRLFRLDEQINRRRNRRTKSDSIYVQNFVRSVFTVKTRLVERFRLLPAFSFDKFVERMLNPSEHVCDFVETLTKVESLSNGSLIKFQLD